LKENQQQIWLEQPKSAVAKHTFNDELHIHLSQTKTLSNKNYYRSWIIKEEIELYPSNEEVGWPNIQ
jgi:hypothetical protein